MHENRLSKEESRLIEERLEPVPKWQKWGPYISERSWGSVREDYSENGDPWNYFPYERAISKAFRWGEDGIAGWCDRYQVLALAPAFWNGRDPFLKERLFGLNNHEGNHGEDVKEYYYFLDATPSHSYMKYLYKYPQQEFPYQKLREENRKKSTLEPEYELIDTGIFNEGDYFDIFIEYAKESPEDLCIQVEIFNRGKKEAPLHFLMQLWFRNQWAWKALRDPEPKITSASNGHHLCLCADDKELLSPSNLAFDYHLGKRFLYGPPRGKLFFTNNETRFSNEEGYYKDAFHRAIIHGEKKAVNAEETGTKACLHYFIEKIPAQQSIKLHFRFSPKELKHPLQDVEEIVRKRKKEADQFYETVHPKEATDEEKQIQRQALAGLVWSKQIYLFDVNVWLKGDNLDAPPPISRFNLRNIHWRHLNSMRIMLMPDTWEYPWFAAWDHAFHCISYALIDLEYAKEQLWLLLFDQFQHPNGQIPAYEWEFSDLNPPVQAWAALRLFHREKELNKQGDLVFLEKCFHKLLMNFSWWVNKVDSSGNNVFEGGFLGLDNITVLDRSKKFPGGAVLQQSDGTGWMAMFCLNLMRIALELSKKNKVYESLATKFFEHYVYIAHAMKKRGNQNYELWSERDGFFYDVLTYPDGTFSKFRVRSLVGLIPLYAIEILHEEEIKHFPEFYKNFHWFMKNRSDLVEACIIPTHKNNKTHYVLTLMNAPQLQSVLKYVWNPEEFRSNYGLRSLSKYHEKHPFVFQERSVGYEPAESRDRLKGGNSNWRGPIWMPTTFLLVDSLLKLTEAYGDEIQGQTDMMAAFFANHMISIFTKDKNGKRPYLGEHFPFHGDPSWSDHLLFYEYFNPETGKGLGASHQTGWSALVANFIDEFR
ncbi:MAG TPA: glucosidase [Rhabdochlamydiaceae bacterium]|nr:glucosidase [Rhabdochlamydiaceae bacterium]